MNILCNWRVDYSSSQTICQKNSIGFTSKSNINVVENCEIPVSSFHQGDLMATSDYFFGDPFVFRTKARTDVLNDIYLWERACKRSGNVCVRNRSETLFSRVKIRPQKGTGRARLGDRGAPHLHHGGKAHAPKPKNYAYFLPKKMIRLGLRMCFAQKNLEKNLIIIKDLKKEIEVLKTYLQKNRYTKACIVDLNINDSLINTFIELRHVELIHLFSIKITNLLKTRIVFISNESMNLLQKYLIFDHIPASNSSSYFQLFEQNKLLDKCFAPAIRTPRKKTHRYILYKGQRNTVYSKRYDLLRKYKSKARQSKGLGARG